MKLKTITWDFFSKHNPCYDPQDSYGDFSGTILDILKDERIPNNDKIWAVTRDGVLDDKTLRLFACACAREVWHLFKDERSLKAIEVIERYANGMATEEELAAAQYAAWAAAWDAEQAEAQDAAQAARAAARDAARAAAWDAAWDAARAEARYAAWEAARDKQVKILIRLIEEAYDH